MTVEEVRSDRVRRAGRRRGDRRCHHHIGVRPRPAAPGRPGLRPADREPAAVIGAEEYLSWLAVEKGRSRNTLVAYRRDIVVWEGWAGEAGIDPVRRRHRGHRAPPGRTAGQGRNPASMARLDHRAARAVPLPGRGGGDRRRSDRRHAVTPPAPPAAQGPRRGAGRGPARRRWAATPRPTCGTGPCSNCCTAPGPASPRWSGCRSATSRGTSGLLRVFGKGSKERLVPLGGPPAWPSSAGSSPAGRPLLAPERWAPARTPRRVFINTRGGRLSRQGAWAVVHRHAERVGLGGRGQPPRAPPLVRQPHARPRRRHPGGPGAARPRLHRHHPDLHQAEPGPSAYVL